jgi:hypothetical protein
VGREGRLDAGGGAIWRGAVEITARWWRLGRGAGSIGSGGSSSSSAPLLLGSKSLPERGRHMRSGPESESLWTGSVSVVSSGSGLGGSTYEVDARGWPRRSPGWLVDGSAL